LNWTPGLDPKTGKPLNYDPNADVQIYAPGSHGTRTRPLSEKLCPSAQQWLLSYSQASRGSFAKMAAEDIIDQEEGDAEDIL
jgi:hypothetical protein